jgi:two-component system nitrogen regulation response regulator NtrX
VIAATNKDLKKEIQENRFREDLYHRLSVILVKVPALKDRTDDIPDLVQKFLADVAEESKSKVKDISPKALAELGKHSWTGNIRELRNVVERLVIMSGQQITDADVKKYL